MLLVLSTSRILHWHQFSHNKITSENFNIARWAVANSNEYKLPEFRAQCGGEKAVVSELRLQHTQTLRPYLPNPSLPPTSPLLW